MLISIRTITITAFLVWFSAFFVLFFPALELRWAVKELWNYPFIYSPEVSTHAKLIERLVLLGCSVGFILFGSLCDRIGRYKTMLIGMASAPFFATLCGYFSDKLFFLVSHFLIGMSVGGTLISSVILIFETVPPRWRWRVFSCAILGGAFGVVVLFLLDSISGWRSLYQIQVLPIFLTPILWYWSDEPLIWKIVVRDYLVDNPNNLKITRDNFADVNNSDSLLSKKQSVKKEKVYRFYVTIINNLAHTYFLSLGDVLSRRRRLLLSALFLSAFGICGLAISLITFDDGMRRRAFQSYDLDERIASRIQDNDVFEDDFDAALVAYIIEKPLVLDLVKSDDVDGKINLTPLVLRHYGYSRDDVSGCVADGLFELVKRLRGERITKDLVAERAVLRWNSKYGNGQAEIDIPESVRNRILLKAKFFITVGERTVQEILFQKQQAESNRNNGPNEKIVSKERKKTGVDKWQEWHDEFLLIWDNLLFVTEIRFIEIERLVSLMLLFFLIGNLVCGFLGLLFGGWGRSWTRRRIFSVIFLALALLSMAALMLLRIEVLFGVRIFYSFLCGLFFGSVITCYLATIPSMFSVIHRGAAVGFCFGFPLIVTFFLVCIISLPDIYYLIPLCFIFSVFAIGIPARKRS
ncbi:MAG: MFS transporter [Planctomycetaceae bacterium]|jgi:MFS family permease|nr:MFS transporter [Planctomycetaceae bacterium]